MMPKPFYLFLMMQWLSVTLYAAVLDVQRPTGNTFVNEPFLSVSVNVDTTAIDMLMINVDLNQTYPIFIDPAKKSYCQSVTLKLGENMLYITGYFKKEKVERKVIKLFYTSPVHKEYKYQPEKYITGPFHLEENERSCQPCHDMSVNEEPGVAFEDVTLSNCYTCHKNLTKRQHGHAPAVNWLCTSCHNGKKGTAQTASEQLSRFALSEPIAPTCFVCHDKWDKPHTHEPVESGFCNRCHYSHSSDEAFFLKKNAWDLCVTCHADKVSGDNHIVGVFGRQNHPTRGVPDPSQPGKQLTCSSCHMPHGSKSRYLLRSDSESIYGLCDRCHKK